MIAPTTPPPTFEMLFEETEPTFLEVFNKVSLKFGLYHLCLIVLLQKFWSPEQTILIKTFRREFRSQPNRQKSM